jgi:hypothetical protein
MVRRTHARILPPSCHNPPWRCVKLKRLAERTVGRFTPRALVFAGVNTMLRKIMMACVATVAIAVAALPTDASARGGWHGGGGHGWHGGGWHGGWHGGYRGYGYGYRRGYYPLYGAAVGLGLYGAYNYGCYRNVRVRTPYGRVWRRVWVCG